MTDTYEANTIMSNGFMMTTISDVARSLDELFERAGTKPKKSTRASRRNKARVIYRAMKRPGLVNPQPVDEDQVSPLIKSLRGKNI